MADAFERELVLLLDEPPALEGEEVFAAGVEARIERAWRLRRWVIGLATTAGAGLTVMALARAGVGLGALDGLTAALTTRPGLRADDLSWLAAAALVALAGVCLPRMFEDS